MGLKIWPTKRKMSDLPTLMLVSVQTRFSKVNVGWKRNGPPTFRSPAEITDFCCWKTLGFCGWKLHLRLWLFEKFLWMKQNGRILTNRKKHITVNWQKSDRFGDLRMDEVKYLAGFGLVKMSAGCHSYS